MYWQFFEERTAGNLQIQMISLVEFSSSCLWFSPNLKKSFKNKDSENFVIAPLILWQEGGWRGRSGWTDAWVDLLGLALSKEWEQRKREQEHCVPFLMVNCRNVYVFNRNLHHKCILLVIFSYLHFICRLMSSWGLVDASLIHTALMP